MIDEEVFNRHQLYNCFEGSLKLKILPSCLHSRLKEYDTKFNINNMCYIILA